MTEGITIQEAENAVNETTAVIDFARFAKAWRLDYHVETMKEEDADSFEALKRKLMNAILDGSLGVSGDGVMLTYTIQFPLENGETELEMRPPTGEALVMFDRLKDRQNIAKLNSYMASMCKTNPAIFVRMDGRDLKIFQAVATIFLAS
jgi:hypothetical protein